MISLSEQGRLGDLERRVLVLLATFNGALYLEEQLQSIASQTWREIDIIASDDGSTDATLKVLADWAARWKMGSFRIVAGPKSGFAANFRSLILDAPWQGSFVAFCDQDDVWDPGKLEAAIEVLRGRTTAALYGSRSRLIGPAGEALGLSPLFPRPPSFANAIVQSLAGGNTMVMNARAFALLRESARRTPFLMHDWWSYLIVSGAGGLVHYDPTPRIGYRQHPGNAIGGGMGQLGRVKRLWELLTGKFSRWSDRNLAALELCADLLTEQSRATLARFKQLRRSGPLRATRLLLQAGIYRQTLKGNIALGIAVALRRI